MLTASNTLTSPEPSAGRIWRALQPQTERPVPILPRRAAIAEEAGAPAPDLERASPAATETFGDQLAREMIELRGYALWLCRSNILADDLIQETFLKAWSAQERFQMGTNMKAWCTTILRNAFYSHRRRSWRSVPLPDEVADELSVEGADCSHKLDLLALRNAIALLPNDQREALLLVGVGAQSYIQAAEVFVCAVGTVKSRVSRARVRVAALLAENKAGFGSDSTLSANDALDDLLNQVACIKGRAACNDERKDMPSSPEIVHSEAA